MRSQDYFRMVATNLRNRKGRVVLTANGVLIGTAAVVLLMSLGIGMQRGVMVQFESIGDLRTIRVSPAYLDGGQQRLTGEAQILRPLDETALAEIGSLSNVTSVVPRLRPTGYVEPVFEDWSSTANLMGLDVRDLAELGLMAQLGTTRLKRGTVILGQAVLDSFGEWIEFSNGSGIQYIQLAAEDLLEEDLRFVLYKAGGEQTKTVTMQVAGILAGESVDRNIYLSVEDLVAWETYVTGRPVHLSREGFSEASVTAAAVSDVAELADAIESLGFTALTSALIEQVQQTYRLISILLGLTGVISLVMAGVGVANTMTAATLEQTTEIGLWKALGASNRDVLRLILGQSAGIGLLGGLGGALVGRLGVWLFNLLGGMTVTVEVYDRAAEQVMLARTPFWLLLAAPVFALLVGVASGLPPAMHAASLPPIVALQEE